MAWKSKAQRRKFFADPKLRQYVAEFAAATPKGAKLPERVHPKKPTAPKRLHKLPPKKPSVAHEALGRIRVGR